VTTIRARGPSTWGQSEGLIRITPRSNSSGLPSKMWLVPNVTVSDAESAASLRGGSHRGADSRSSSAQVQATAPRASRTFASACRS
jgi:hypothetical protein